MAHAAETSTHRITLDFEDAETLVLALEHIGDRDAPVMITGGTVTAGGPTYQLHPRTACPRGAGPRDDRQRPDPSGPRRSGS